MKILVVDDEFPARERLRRLLSETDGDHELAGEATNGLEAIDRCRAQPIDLVLMDTQMPGMSGLEAARRLALLERPPTIILMSPTNTPPGLADTERRIAGRLLKPAVLNFKGKIALYSMHWRSCIVYGLIYNRLNI